MKPLFKKLIIWSSTLTLSCITAFVSFYDFSSNNTNHEDNNNNNNNNGNNNDPVLTPQQKFLNSLVSLDEAKINGNISVTSTNNNLINVGLNGDLILDIDEVSNTKFSGDVTISYNDISANGSLSYINNKVYFDYNDSKMYLETDSILDFVNMIPNYGIDISLPSEITNIDLNNIMNQLQTMEPESAPNGYFFRLYLTSDIELCFKSDTNYNFVGVRTNKFYFEDNYIYLDFDVDQDLEESLVINEPDVELYQDFSPAFDLVNVLYNTFNKKENTLNLKVDISNLNNPYLNLDADISYDTSLNKVSLLGNVNEINYSRNHDFILGVSDDNLFVNYNNLKVSIENQSINAVISYLMNKVGDTILNEALGSLDGLLTNSDLNDILNNLSNVNNLISSINVTNNELSVTINLEFLGIDAKELVLSFNFDSQVFKVLSLKGLNINGYQIDISLNTKEYNLINFNKEEYVAIDPSLCLITAIDSLSKENTFRIELDGNVSETIKINGGLQFDLLNEFGYGELDLVDGSNLNHNIKLDLRSYSEILFSYNTNLKGRFTSNFFTDAIGMVNEILNNKDDHFYEIFGDLLNGFSSLPILDAINNEDYGMLFEIGLIDGIEVTDNYLRLNIKEGLIGIDSSFILEIGYDRYEEDYTSILKYLKVTDFVYGSENIDFTLNLKKFNQSLDSERLDPKDYYIEFDSLTVLLRLGINTSIYNYYHFNGNIVMSLFGIFDAFKVPIDLKVANNKGDVSVEATLGIPYFPFVTSGVNSIVFYNRVSKIYFHDNLLYIYRSEYSDIFHTKTYEIYTKITPEEFLNNPVYYMCDVLIGFSDTVLNSINNSAGDSGSDSTDSTIHFENILTDFSYEEGSEKTYFDFKINMSEILKNDMLQNTSLKVFVNKEKEELNAIELDVVLFSVLHANMHIDLVDLNEAYEGMDLTNLLNYVNAHSNDVINQVYEKK